MFPSTTIHSFAPLLSGSSISSHLRRTRTSPADADGALLGKLFLLWGWLIAEGRREADGKIQALGGMLPELLRQGLEKGSGSGETESGATPCSCAESRLGGLCAMLGVFSPDYHGGQHDAGKVFFFLSRHLHVD